GIVALIAIVVIRARPRRSTAIESRSAAVRPAICAVLWIAIAVRIFWSFADSHVAIDHSFDAVDNWLLRAKVVVSLRHLPTRPSDPYYLGGGKIASPLGMPMLAAWPAILLGRWDERVVGLLWPVYFVALLGTLGGFVARRAGVAVGLFAAYILSSIPLIDMH